LSDSEHFLNQRKPFAWIPWVFAGSYALVHLLFWFFELPMLLLVAACFPMSLIFLDVFAFLTTRWLPFELFHLLLWLVYLFFGSAWYFSLGYLFKGVLYFCSPKDSGTGTKLNLTRLDANPRLKTDVEKLASKARSLRHGLAAPR
jgi:hypothetical protein